MKIEINEKEIIELSNFELSWRWAKTHSPDISDSELKQIIPVSESESQRLNKAIVYFEQERNLWGKYKQTDWIRATDETEEKESDFRSKLTSIIEPWNEGVIVTWNRRTTL